MFFKWCKLCDFNDKKTRHLKKGKVQEFIGFSIITVLNISITSDAHWHSFLCIRITLNRFICMCVCVGAWVVALYIMFTGSLSLARSIHTRTVTQNTHFYFTSPMHFVYCYVSLWNWFMMCFVRMFIRSISVVHPDTSMPEYRCKLFGCLILRMSVDVVWYVQWLSHFFACACTVRIFSEFVCIEEILFIQNRHEHLDTNRSMNNFVCTRRFVH